MTRAGFFLFGDVCRNFNKIVVDWKKKILVYPVLFFYNDKKVTDSSQGGRYGWEPFKAIM
ncbi:hypothetical protein GCM10023228_15520 [Brevibacillus fulvus]